MTDNDQGTPNPWSREGNSESEGEQPTRSAQFGQAPQSGQPEQVDAADQTARPGQPDPAAPAGDFGQGTESYQPTAEYPKPEYGAGYQPMSEYPAAYGAYGTSSGTPSYGTAPYGMPPYGAGPQSTTPSSIYPQPPQRSGRRSGSGKAVVVAAVVALLAGGAAGGVGGYLAASEQSSVTTATENALNEPRPARQTGNAPDGSIESVAQKVTPSVVQIEVASADGAGEGSGFVLTDNGYILTNNHVVESAADGNGQIRVAFENGQRAEASVVGRDPTTDIAVVKADGVSGLQPVELGRSDDLNVGQQVVAIGSPFQLSGTVTSGIVSALHRPVRAGGSSGDLASVMDAIQTDAAINPGNSGGPLVDMSGRVIGINSAIYSPGGISGSSAGNVGIGFAIPIDQARRTADEIIKTGKATQTYIGALVSDARDRGAAIREVESDGPAAEAGLKKGDVVIKVGDRFIEDADELVAAIRTRAPGEEVPFTLQNNKTITVTLGAKTVGG
ncbi:S1C family serine protease [Haloechinothrix salitolerans]|uniref:Trypsin-like peptidase domain-containing protein n=1 Tax=Haloechinothrix salitolerans TaxID=926830 RepID=A0ABW2BXD8_9PSEU